VVIAPLDRKLLRDLRSLRGQVITITLVVACGIASFVTMKSAYDSLIFSRDAYYARYRLADVFAHLERAPASVAERISAIPGVAVVETRVVESVSLPMPEMLEPARAVIISLPASGAPRLNAVHLAAGRFPDPERSDEVIVLASFAEEHGLEPGSRFPAVINGTRRELTAVGIGMSPEYVFAMTPGELTYDPKRSTVLWLPEAAAAAAFRLEGAFNDVSLQLQPGASVRAVLDALDGLLGPYGGLGAVPRERQPSNFMLSGELQQLEQMGTSLPLIFLAVAAFLVNVVLSRLVYLQRPEIATLKAVGYADRAIAEHYLKLVGVIATLGALAGIGLGTYLGDALVGLYTGQFFRFPDPVYRLEPNVLLIGVGVSFGAAVLGALLAVRSVTKLPPAEAMRPPTPATYHRTRLRSRGLLSFLGPSARMALRELERRPVRSLLSAVGIALAVGILVIGRFMYDAMDQLVFVHFERAMREDVNVTFMKALPERAVRELAHLPGVHAAEPLRAVGVRFRSGHRHRDGALTGYPPGGQLRQLLDKDGEPAALPEDGVVLTTLLGEILDVRLGQDVTVELLEGDRRILALPVAGFVDESFGLQGHMHLDALHRVLGEESLATTALLTVDPDASVELHHRLRDLPWVAGVSSPKMLKQHFDAQSGDTMAIFTLVLTVFASVIAVGIVYNNARVALSQRARDLASLRVLGFSRGEIAGMLFAELAVQVALGIPLGLLVGRVMAIGMMSTVDAETYRFSVVISARTYAFAASIALATALVSALLVRRKLDHLDLIGVLKTRE
jgi:putative ABC transport system permease protein